MVVWNACLLTCHTYNWMMVCLMMKIATKIRSMRSTLLTLGGLWPWMRITVLTMLMCRKIIHTHGSSPSPLAWNNGQDHCGMYHRCKCQIMWPCNIIFLRSWIKHSPLSFGLNQRICAPKNVISLGGWWVWELHQPNENLHKTMMEHLDTRKKKIRE